MPPATSPLGPISDHLSLVRRMARATGVDLAAALQDGAITSAEWAQMVTNCRGCANAVGCRVRLAALEIADQQDAAPDYCENRAGFDALTRPSA